MKAFGQKAKMERHNQANILITTLLIFLVCSSLMLVILENYRLTIDINKRTEKYYIAKIMKQLALSRITNEKVKGNINILLVLFFTLNKITK
ncbi:competence type IV pilus minor pilin ComGG [Enterococcus durans]|uniref:competence type IV pilus minor pilin ComGG n=2 Tax=Enterococcus durans TaxID=53345 RepID=UPI003BD3F31D